MMRKNNRILLIFAALVIAYMAISIWSPPNPKSLQQYHVTLLNARLLNLSFVVPLAAVWFVAYYGYTCFRDYAERVRDTHEGFAFRLIERGVMVFVFALPVQGIINSATNTYSIYHPWAAPVLIIIRNYLYMLFYTSALLLMAKGCSTLLFSLKKIPLKHPPVFLTLSVVILSTAYVALIINTVMGAQDAIYHLPTWLVVTTIAIPYLFAWSRILQGLYDLSAYLNLIRGKVYKSALKAVIVGISAITILNIILQLLTAASPKLNRLHLTPILFIIYLLVFCYAIGFILLARGSRKLIKIEEA